MLLSSFLSMMAVFVGSEGGDLRDLIVLQAFLIPAALATVAWCILELVRRYGFRGAMHTLWQHLPGWLLRSEEHTSELQSREKLVCRLLLERKNILSLSIRVMSGIKP